MNNDRLGASWVLMVGAIVAGYWFWHLDGAVKKRLLHPGAAAGEGGHPAGLAPYTPGSGEIAPAQKSIDSAPDWIKKLREKYARPSVFTPGINPAAGDPEALLAAWTGGLV